MTIALYLYKMYLIVLDNVRVAIFIKHANIQTKDVIQVLCVNFPGFRIPNYNLREVMGFQSKKMGFFKQF